MASLRTGTLLVDIPRGSAEEIVEPLAAGGGVRIERIVSTGQASPPGFWYDQDEFVVLVAGAARLRFADDHVVDLKPGDWVEIPAHVRHRVEETQAEPPTVWLAIHRPAACD